MDALGAIPAIGTSHLLICIHSIYCWAIKSQELCINWIDCCKPPNNTGPSTPRDHIPGQMMKKIFERPLFQQQTRQYYQSLGNPILRIDNRIISNTYIAQVCCRPWACSIGVPNDTIDSLVSFYLLVTPGLPELPGIVHCVSYNQASRLLSSFPEAGLEDMLSLSLRKSRTIKSPALNTTE